VGTEKNRSLEQQGIGRKGLIGKGGARRGNLNKNVHPANEKGRRQRNGRRSARKSFTSESHKRNVEVLKLGNKMWGHGEMGGKRSAQGAQI